MEESSSGSGEEEVEAISVREFQRSAKKYIKKLPLTLTRYNKPIATIVAFAQEGRDRD